MSPMRMNSKSQFTETIRMPPLGRLARVAICLACVASLASCGSFESFKNKAYADYAIHPLATKDMATSLPDGRGGSTQENLFSILTQSKLVSSECLALDSSSTDANKLKQCATERMQLISSLMMVSENLCVAHRRTIYGNEAVLNSTLGSSTNFFAGAAAITSGATASLYSALALFSNAERSLFNEAVYKNMIVAAVDDKIVETRSVKADAIYARLTGSKSQAGAPPSMEEYPIPWALHDFYDFHYSCAFMNGLRLALKEGTQDTPEKKRSRLQKRLMELNLEIATVSSTDTKRLSELEGRRKSLSDEITTLEKQ